jgi:hypothetical protein
MSNYQTNLQVRRTAITGLAVVGFIALVAAGIWLAVYSTRFVPKVVNGFGEAAVYLGSILIPNHTSGLSVVPTPTASTTISFGATDATSTSATSTAPKQIATTAGTETSGTYQINGTSAPVLSGLSDLIVHINAIGYLSTDSTNSFISSATVPAGSRPAVSFTIKNIGTNASGQWRFSASIPTQTGYIYQSQLQQSLNPGDSIDYILGFDQANVGANKTVSITANFDHAIAESNTNNDSASVTMTILGP